MLCQPLPCAEQVALPRPADIAMQQIRFWCHMSFITTAPNVVSCRIEIHARHARHPQCRCECHRVQHNSLPAGSVGICKICRQELPALTARRAWAPLAQNAGCRAEHSGGGHPRTAPGHALTAACRPSAPPVGFVQRNLHKIGVDSKIICLPRRPVVAATCLVCTEPTGGAAYSELRRLSRASACSQFLQQQ